MRYINVLLTYLLTAQWLLATCTTCLQSSSHLQARGKRQQRKIMNKSSACEIAATLMHATGILAICRTVQRITSAFLNT